MKYIFSILIISFSVTGIGYYIYQHDTLILKEKSLPKQVCTEIYIKPTCSYCKRAMALLDQKGIPYHIYDVTHNKILRDFMIQRSQGRKTTPQIFIQGSPIGGYTDLARLEKSGRLDALLLKCNSS